MFIKREWGTPVTAGAFLLSAVTGILMFFHIDTGLNKFAHEWLSWILLIGVALHLITNFSRFKWHMSARKEQLIVGVFMLALLLSFIPAGEKSSPPFAQPIKMLSKAPLTTLALVAQISPEQLRGRLAKAGVTSHSDQQNLNELIGQDLRKQIQILRTLFDDK